jgi:peptide/nickel transport system substrate-binding protein
LLRATFFNILEEFCMKRIEKTIMSVLCAALICCGALSCVKKDSATGEKVLTVASYRDGAFEELDAAGYNGPHWLFKMIYESFVEDGGSGKLIPKLAERWDIAEDGKTYTFHLRHGVKFSDGTPFNADAVIFNLKRWVNNKRHALLTSSLVVRMEALDDYTVLVEFQDAFYPIIMELTYPRPVRFLSPASLQSDGTFAKPVGTGPWMIENYVKDEEFSLVPNPYYWGNAPKIDRIVFKVIADGQARVLALQSGEIDILGGDLLAKIPMESVTELKQNTNFETHILGTLCAHFIAFNQSHPIFQDKNVRIAMNYAINKKVIAENLFDGVGIEAKGLYQEKTPYTTAENNYCAPYDKNKAIELLESAGWIDEDGDGIREKNNTKMEFNFLFSIAEFPEWKSLAEFIQSEFNAVGIKLNLTSLDRNGYEEASLTTRNFDLALKRTSSDSWVPHGSVLELFAPSVNSSPDVGNAWLDKDLYALVLKTLGTIDENERQKMYDEVFGTISAEALTIPVYHPTTSFAVNTKKVKDFIPGVNNYAPVEWERLDVN